MISLAAVASKTVFLVVMACTGDPVGQTCGDTFEAESWVAPTQALAKQECETFLREEFDPKNYITIEEGDYVSVRCE